MPSRSTYPHQWNWDSALIALGWAELDPGRAWTELETLMGARDEVTGLVPHIAFHTRLPDRLGGRLRGVLTQMARPGRRYMPGPVWWGPYVSSDGRRISQITQPPIAATCMRLLFEQQPDERRARALIEPLVRWHRFLLEERDPLGHSEPAIIHPWETGRDNAVEWDTPLWRVVPEVIVLHRRDTDSVEAAERPTDEHYRRYLTLVRRGAATGWPQSALARSGPFKVLDPGFSAILARATADLAWVAEALGEARYAEESRNVSEYIASALKRRADSDGLIRPLDLMDETPLEVTGAGSALALLSPDLERRQVEAARDLVIDGPLASDFGVRSLEPEHPDLEPRNYWRGPVWANVTWICAHALDLHGEPAAAATLRERMLEAVDGGGMREYFLPGDGEGLGARDFAWTAALTLRELAAAPAGAEAA